MNRSSFHRLGGIAFLAFALSGCMAAGTPSAGQPTAASTAAPAATAAPGQPTAAPATPAPNKPTATPSPVAGKPTVVPATPADAQPGTPTFGFTPQNGGPGTRVTLNGWNFAPGKPVVVRLGTPQPMGEVLVAATPDAQGKWSAALVMPDRFPSGDPITQRDLQLVVMDEANVALASAPFAFAPAAGNPIPPREAASQTVSDMLGAYVNGGDVAAFLSADLRARLQNGEAAGQLLGMPANTLQMFDVGAPLNRPADALFIPAQLTYADLQEAREFTVVLEQNSWKVAGSNPPVGQPVPPADDQEIHSALTADLNGDGELETITYRTGRVKISTPTGFSDPSIVAVVVAQELFVTQGPVPGGRVLLYLNPIALNSENGRLLLMGQQNEPNPGFLVVVYGGENHSYYITPIASDGTPGNQSVRAVWSAEQNAYVLG